MAKIVKLVIEKKPEVKYIFSFDCTAQHTSYDIILNISRGIGSGKVKSIPSNESYLKNLQGPASHANYKARQIHRARVRIFGLRADEGMIDD